MKNPWLENKGVTKGDVCLAIHLMKSASHSTYHICYSGNARVGRFARLVSHQVSSVVTFFASLELKDALRDVNVGFDFLVSEPISCWHMLNFNYDGFSIVRMQPARE